MSEELKLRDSGISMDDDESQKSLSTSTSSISDCKSNNNFSYVQSLRKRFECLAREKFHTECNWWLDGVNEEKEHEQVACKIIEATNKLVESEGSSILKQNKIILNLEAAETREIRDNEEIIIETKRTNPPIFRLSSLQPPPIPPRRISKMPSVEIEPSPHPDTNDEEDEEEEDDNHDHDNSDSFESDTCEDEIDDIGEDIDVANSLIQNPTRSSRPVSTTSSQHSNISFHSKLFNILSELFENEKSYVKTLEKGIENYMNALDRKGLPKPLRGQKFHVFANIAGIYNFHKNEFLPSLLACDEDEPIQVAEIFTHFITKDYFYSYVIYAINRKRSELLCNQCMDFWREIQNECGDRLGINSFLLQPIQRLPRYKLLLNEIIKDLSKDLENTKQAIAAFCVAEKNIQRLLDIVNDSMSINDIKNCFEIDVLCQGKFKRVDEFDIFMWETRRKFRGKVFMFENCIVYTEALNREFMDYRGHFDMNSVGISCKNGKSKFKLFPKRSGTKDVEFRSSLNVVCEWNEHITGMLMKFVIEEKRRHEFRRKSSIHAIKARTSDSLRSSVMSSRSDDSSINRGSNGSFTGRENFDLLESEQQSQWYI